ncbi:MAG: desulfoferrodoxin [Candidatus Nezhaarchaeota archaeon]|nr:desulfoferrodoxin [Candidatus Nezhaarchaeota archaeon]
MALFRAIYKCNICGNIVEVLHEGRGQLVCCGQPMQLLEEKVIELDKEKHAPIIEVTDGVVKVKVGSIPHPMEEKHFIEWIELSTNRETHRRYLNPGEEPIAIFNIRAEKLTARAYCNLHGLWKST